MEEGLILVILSQETINQINCFSIQIVSLTSNELGTKFYIVLINLIHIKFKLKKSDSMTLKDD